MDNLLIGLTICPGFRYHVVMIPRILEKKIKSLAKVSPIVALIGPRQSGKTTLIKSIFEKYPYVNFEDFGIKSFAKEDPKGFLLKYKNGVILDEVQKVPELFPYLQTISDESNRPGQFILTGSQNFLMQEKISQSLAGRVVLLRLLPLSIEELSASKYKFTDMESAMFKGFYPRLFSQKISPLDWYPSYIQTYVERDVRQIKNIPDLSTFQKFLKFCAGRIGQLLNLSSLATECGINHNTAKSWISVLEASFIVFLLQPHHKNFNKRIVKMPKLYFCDTGVACSLLGIEKESQLSTHYLRGGLFENMVISEIVKDRLNKGLEPKCFFWRDKSGREIDCLIEKADKFVAIEIKAAKTASKEYFDNLIYWNSLSGNGSDNSFVVYGGEETLKNKFGTLLNWKGVGEIVK